MDKKHKIREDFKTDFRNLLKKHCANVVCRHSPEAGSNTIFEINDEPVLVLWVDADGFQENLEKFNYNDI